MPPRHAYWTILVDDQPTAFRAHDPDELLPTLNRLKEKNPSAVMKWFERGQLFESRDAARDAGGGEGERRWEGPRPERDADAPPREKRARPQGDRRGRDWRPGGEHQDPRQKYKDAKKAKWDRFKQNIRDRADRRTATPAGDDPPLPPETFSPPHGDPLRDQIDKTPDSERRDEDRSGPPSRPHGDKVKPHDERPEWRPREENPDTRPARRDEIRGGDSDTQRGNRPRSDRPWSGPRRERPAGSERHEQPPRREDARDVAPRGKWDRGDSSSSQNRDWRGRNDRSSGRPAERPAGGPPRDRPSNSEWRDRPPRREDDRGADQNRAARGGGGGDRRSERPTDRPWSGPPRDRPAGGGWRERPPRREDNRGGPGRANGDRGESWGHQNRDQRGGDDRRSSRPADRPWGGPPRDRPSGDWPNRPRRDEDRAGSNRPWSGPPRDDRRGGPTENRGDGPGGPRKPGSTGGKKPWGAKPDGGSSHRGGFSSAGRKPWSSGPGNRPTGGPPRRDRPKKRGDDG